MNDTILDLLMYLDEGLVKNLSSLVLSGYIEIRTTKIIQDKTISGRFGYDTREHYFSEDRNTEDNRDGFITNNYSNADHEEKATSGNVGAENRDFIRKEEELKRIYTTFTLHSQLLTSLSSSNKIKEFNNSSINAGDVLEGEYVKIKGQLTSESINSYLDALLNTVRCLGGDALDAIIKKSDAENIRNSIMNFSAINNILSHLNNILSTNYTQDMILNCGDTSIVLNVNSNFFMNNNSYIYDKVDCPCTVFGKVVSIADRGHCISLLRKTAQQDFYENILNSCTSYCDILTSNGIIMPKIPRLKCKGLSFVIIPISICM